MTTRTIEQLFDPHLEGLVVTCADGQRRHPSTLGSWDDARRFIITHTCERGPGGHRFELEGLGSHGTLRPAQSGEGRIA